MTFLDLDAVNENWLRQRVGKKVLLSDLRRKYNPYHEPRGSSVGGEFAHAPGEGVVLTQGSKNVPIAALPATVVPQSPGTNDVQITAFVESVRQRVEPMGVVDKVRWQGKPENLAQGAAYVGDYRTPDEAIRHYTAIDIAKDSGTIGSSTVEEYLDQWSYSDVNGLRGAMRMAVAEKFDASYAPPKKVTEKTFQVAKEYVDAQYQHTQDVLASEGVDSVLLYRGANYSDAGHQAPAELAAIPSDGQWHEMDVVQANPLKSWTLDPGKAGEFAANTWDTSPVGPNQQGFIFAAQVPRQRIFSSALTGAGQASETEYVVIGGGGKQSVMRIDPSEMVKQQ